MPNNLRSITDRIIRDMEAGIISPKTPRCEIIDRYRYGPVRESCWLDFIRAMRILGVEKGTISCVDDKRDIFLASMDSSPDTTEEDVIAFADPILRRHLQRMGGRRTRVTMYRLPRGDYSNENTAFFEERAEYLFECNAGRQRMSA